jgi:hypothetical protein
MRWRHLQFRKLTRFRWSGFVRLVLITIATIISISQRLSSLGHWLACNKKRECSVEPYCTQTLNITYSASPMSSRLPFAITAEMLERVIGLSTFHAQSLMMLKLSFRKHQFNCSGHVTSELLSTCHHLIASRFRFPMHILVHLPCRPSALGDANDRAEQIRDVACGVWMGRSNNRSSWRLVTDKMVCCS